jgi:pimeloyl-ACP methyl ester carboxylesterase
MPHRNGPESTCRIELSGFTLNIGGGELHDTGGRRIALRPQSLSVLQYLGRNADRVVGKAELMQAVWPGVVVTDDSLVQCIKELRKALGDDKHCLIETEHRRGYRLVTAGANRPEAKAVEPDFSQDIRFARSSDGTRIAWADCGDGPPLVRTAQWMTHLDWDLQSSIFGPFIRRLAKRNRLIRYDGRGCGLSDRGVPMATLDDEMRDLEAVVDSAGLERFALLGRSQGGCIAIHYAARHPERVSQLVVIGGHSRGRLRRGEQSQTLDNVLAFCAVLEEGWGKPNSALRQVWTSQAFPGATAEQQDEYNQMQRVACTPQDAATIHRMTAEYDSSTDLPHVRCPTLVLHNPDDALVPFEEGRLIASSIPRARLETFASRNHVPLPGEPAFEHVMTMIDAFLLGSVDEQQTSAAAPRPALRSVMR